MRAGRVGHRQHLNERGGVRAPILACQRVEPDRDAERTAGFRVLPQITREHFEARELVWSRYSIESLFLEPARLATWIAAALPEGAIVSRAARLDEGSSSEVVATVGVGNRSSSGGRASS
jgi:hypothetical protein